MDEPLRTQPFPDVERGLIALFTAPTPHPAFVAGLEQDLLAQRGTHPVTRAWHRVNIRSLWRHLSGPLRQHRWATLAAVLLLVLVSALLAAGPQRVWADIQERLGYVSGLGFVNLKEARALAAPVEVTRDGVTLRVVRALALPDRTAVFVRVEGLAPGVKPDLQDDYWTNATRPRLRLPDGTAVEARNGTFSLSEARFNFPPLPADVYRVTLEVLRLPLVPPAAAPEEWTIPFTLRPVAEELSARLFPEPYAPAAADTRHGITVRVLGVAHSPEETAIRLRVRWLDPSWQLHPGLFPPEPPRLHDDVGHHYVRVVPSSGPVVVKVVETSIPDEARASTDTRNTTYERTLTFAPLSSLAGRLTLTVEALMFEVPATGEFVVDLGDTPKIGDYRPLDLRLNVAGFPVHLTGVRLREKQTGPPGKVWTEYELLFDLAPVSPQGERAFRGMRLELGEEVRGSRSSSGTSYNALTRRFHVSVSTDRPLKGRIPIRVTAATVAVRGPWRLTWTVPGRPGGAMSPHLALLYPQNARQTRNDLTLRARAVALTDRVTAITVAAEDLPASQSLVSLRARDPTTGRVTLYVEDERGRRYELNREVNWQPFDGVEGLTYTFQPARPLARRLTLHAGLAEVRMPGTASFDVFVPRNVRLHQTPNRSAMSDPWPVDIPVQIAGYRLRFTEARLAELNDTILVTLESEPFQGEQGDRQLAKLLLSSVVTPDGRSVELKTAFGHAGWTYTEPIYVKVGGPGTSMRSDSRRDMAFRATLGFSVVDPGTGTVQPGRYRVTLEGVTVLLRGPWRLSWNLQTP